MSYYDEPDYYDERDYYGEPEEDPFDEEEYRLDLAFEEIAEAQAEWSEAVFASALELPRKPLGREVNTPVHEVIA